MSSVRAEAGSADPAVIRGRLEAYYTRYYRDTLAIPAWRDLVNVRLADDAYEGRRLARLEQALGRPVSGLRLLNVGCGTGGFNLVATRVGAETWGVDPSAEALAIAERRVRGGQLLCAQAESLPFPDGAFDVVYCYSTLEHVADARRALSEMVRVLRPEGALYLHTPNRWACFESHYKIFWVPGLPRWAGRAYLTARGRPTGFLQTLRPLAFAECQRILREAGACVVQAFSDDSWRPVGGPLWSLIRLYYWLFRIRPYVELVAVKGREP